MLYPFAEVVSLRRLRLRKLLQALSWSQLSSRALGASAMTVPKALKNQRGNGYSGGKRELARDNAHAGGGRLVQAGGKSGRKSGKRAPRVITWDDDARKEFITGFRKRKNERRQHARQKIAEEVRQEKIEMRREQREAFRSMNSVGIGVSDDDDDGDGGDDDAPADAEVATYAFQDTLTTTVVAPMNFGDDEPEVEDERPPEERGEAAPKPKPKVFKLNQPLATAIPGYKPKDLGKSKGSKGRLKSQRKKGKLVSKKEKAKRRSGNGFAGKRSSIRKGGA